MSCDGDTVSITAASQPSIEDVVLGLVPGIPKVHLHNKVLAYETGEDFLAAFRKAAAGQLEPFVLVIEGSVPNERINGDGFWSAFGNDLATGQPKTLDKWLDELAPRALAVMAVGTCATYGGIHSMAGNPTGAMGLADYLGHGFRSKAGLPIINVPGCPVQPDNFMETLLWLLQEVAGKLVWEEGGRRVSVSSPRSGLALATAAPAPGGRLYVGTTGDGLFLFEP